MRGVRAVNKLLPVVVDACYVIGVLIHDNRKPRSDARSLHQPGFEIVSVVRPYLSPAFDGLMLLRPSGLARPASWRHEYEGRRRRINTERVDRSFS